jgi:hypothetical protein
MHTPHQYALAKFIHALASCRGYAASSPLGQAAAQRAYGLASPCFSFDAERSQRSKALSFEK